MSAHDENRDTTQQPDTQEPTALARCPSSVSPPTPETDDPESKSINQPQLTLVIAQATGSETRANDTREDIEESCKTLTPKLHALFTLLKGLFSLKGKYRLLAFIVVIAIAGCGTVKGLRYCAEKGWFLPCTVDMDYSPLTGGPQLSLKYRPWMTPNEPLKVESIVLDGRSLSKYDGSFNCTMKDGQLTLIDIQLPNSFLNERAGDQILVTVKFKSYEPVTCDLILPQRLALEMVGAMPLLLLQNQTNSMTGLGLGTNADLANSMRAKLRSYTGLLGTPRYAYVCGPDEVTLVATGRMPTSSLGANSLHLRIVSVLSSSNSVQIDLKPDGAGDFGATINLATLMPNPWVYFLQLFEGNLIRDEVLLVRCWEPMREITNGQRWQLASHDHDVWEMVRDGSRVKVATLGNCIKQTAGAAQECYVINFRDLSNRGVEPGEGLYVVTQGFSDNSHGSLSLALFGIELLFPWAVGEHVPALKLGAYYHQWYDSMPDRKRWLNLIGGRHIERDRMKPMRSQEVRLAHWESVYDLVSGGHHTASVEFRIRPGRSAGGNRRITLDLYKDGERIGRTIPLETDKLLPPIEASIRNYGCENLVVDPYYIYYLPEDNDGP